MPYCAPVAASSQSVTESFDTEWWYANIRRNADRWISRPALSHLLTLGWLAGFPLLGYMAFTDASSASIGVLVLVIGADGYLPVVIQLFEWANHSGARYYQASRKIIAEQFGKRDALGKNPHSAAMNALLTESEAKRPQLLAACDRNVAPWQLWSGPIQLGLKEYCQHLASALNRADLRGLAEADDGSLHPGRGA